MKSVVCPQIADHIRGRMKNTLAINYGVDVRTNTENRRITESWDSMQRQVSGARGF